MLPSPKSQFKSLQQQYNSNASSVDVVRGKSGFMHIIGRDRPQYNPEYVPFLFSCFGDKYSKQIFMGPYGSGKTSYCVNRMLAAAIDMRPCDDGIRRSRWAIVRNTAGQLETTTLKTWEYWMSGLPTPKRRSKPQLTHEYNFRDERGLIQMEIVFLALDRIDDVRKLDSFELTGVYFNELRHIPKLIFDTMQLRIKRYPAKLNFIKQFENEFGHLQKKAKQLKFKNWEPYIPWLFADTNPPKNKHWIQVLDETKLDKKLKVYHQPPALLKDKGGNWYVNDEADNILFEGNGYYEEMIGRGEEFIKVYGQGKYGTIVDGKPVYAGYNDDIHSVEDIGIDPDEPIYIGVDLGLVSAAFIIKQSAGGQIRAIKEFIGENESVKSLYESAVKPFLLRYCKGMEIICTHDPANTAEGARQLQECGVDSQPARTNHIEPRISCVKNAQDRLSRGRSFYVISRKGCPLLREGMLGEYHYRRLKVVGEEKYVDTPNKVHPYSDIADADQYATMRIYDETGLKQEVLPVYTEHNEEHKSKVTGY